MAPVTRGAALAACLAGLAWRACNAQTWSAGGASATVVASASGVAGEFDVTVTSAQPDAWLAVGFGPQVISGSLMTGAQVVMGCFGCVEANRNGPGVLRFLYTSDSSAAPLGNTKDISKAVVTRAGSVTTLKFTASKLAGVSIATAGRIILGSGAVFGGYPLQHSGRRRGAVQPIRVASPSSPTALPTGSGPGSGTSTPTNPLARQPSRAPSRAGVGSSSLLGGKATLSWQVLGPVAARRRLGRGGKKADNDEEADNDDEADDGEEADDVDAGAGSVVGGGPASGGGAAPGLVRLTLTVETTAWVGLSIGSAAMIGSHAVVGAQSAPGISQKAFTCVLDSKATGCTRAFKEVANVSYKVANGRSVLELVGEGIAGRAFSASDVVSVAYGNSPRFSTHAGSAAETVSISWGAASATARDSSGSSTGLVAHGVLMAAAFLVCFPAGAVVQALRGHLSPRTRLRVHRGVQLAATALVLAAALVVWWAGTTGLDSAHAWLGLALLAAAALQPALACCASLHARRSWRVVHLLLGYAMLGAGVAECLLGLALLRERVADMSAVVVAVEALVLIGAGFTLACALLLACLRCTSTARAPDASSGEAQLPVAVKAATPSTSRDVPRATQVWSPRRPTPHQH